MNDFAVQVGVLDGFGLDLQEVGANFSSNASRMLSGLSVPSGSAGLLASLSTPFENFKATLSAAHQQDLTTLASCQPTLPLLPASFRERITTPRK
ncbi:hypothetical protein ACFO5K_19820 [Nocardia halotolerans]|uniref:Uncharacterized protein n=1 Tax=Nocardia halotolerans TaxID=1755878 RepID=A0ABV8VJU6_9NOCA